MFRQKVLFIMTVAFLLAGCTSPKIEEAATTEIVGQTAVPATPTLAMTETQEVGNYTELLSALQATGATVSETGRLEQTFFGVAAQLIQINGNNVQVYEFADDQAQSQASATISQAGYVIGTTQIEWIDQPHFWAQECLLVLYVGQNEEIVSMLTSLLGEPINEPDMAETTPAAVTAAVNHLSSALAVAATEIEVVSFAQQEWPDGCLGLADAAEMCTQAIVPGWQVILSMGGRQYEVRTNNNGTIVRSHLLDSE
jgi:hypothetical protein